MNTTLQKALMAGAALAVIPVFAFAQDTTAADAAADMVEIAAPTFDEIGPYIMTTLLFLIGGFLVMWMAAGFAMLEAGLVRSKNVTTQLTKNVALFAIAGIMYWLIGYGIMYPGDDGWTIQGYLGNLWSPTSLEPVGLAAGDADLGYASVASDFFFQLMFCAQRRRSCPVHWPSA